MVSDPADYVDFSELAYAYNRPLASGLLKQEFADFQVDEVLGFELRGSGDHRCLQIRKTDLTTTDLLKIIARSFKLRVSDIGYAGMKDRRAVCSQWISIPKVDGKQIDPAKLKLAGVEVLDVQDNDRKIKIGSHKANSFKILLRQFSGSRNEFESRLQKINELGVPNYFGPQRFGKAMNNVTTALDYFENLKSRERKQQNRRFKRGLLLSAARSYLFNCILSRRVSEGTWDQLLDGEVANLAGTNRFFATNLAQSIQGEAGKLLLHQDPSLQARLLVQDIHPSGLLYGKQASEDRYGSRGVVRSLELEVVKAYPELCQGLEAVGMSASRRALRLIPENMGFDFNDERTVELRFTLGSGGYATTLMRELCQTGEQKVQQQGEELF